MNALIASYERRLSKGAEMLGQMEASGRMDSRYHQLLRHWLELLAAYEYESEIAQAGELDYAAVV